MKLFSAIIRSALWALVLLTVSGICLGAPSVQRRILIVKSRDIPFYTPTLTGFIQGLQKRGYDSPDSTEINVIVLTGDPEKDAVLVKQELSKSNNLVLTLGTDATIAVENGQPTCPCLFSMVLDPVSLKIAKSDTKPGGDFTGTTLLVDPGKQLETLEQVSPGVKTVGVLYTDGDATSIAFLAAASQEALALNMQIISQPIGDYATDGRKALSQLAGKVDAFWVIVDPSSASQQALSDTLDIARQHSLPVLGISSANVKAGALISLSANLSDLGDVDAEMACPLLDGSMTPSQTAIRGPRQLVLSINLGTARTLGLKLPESVLHLADEVVDNTPSGQN